MRNFTLRKPYSVENLDAPNRPSLLFDFDLGMLTARVHNLKSCSWGLMPTSHHTSGPQDASPVSVKAISSNKTREMFNRSEGDRKSVV